MFAANPNFQQFWSKPITKKSLPHCSRDFFIAVIAYLSHYPFNYLRHFRINPLFHLTCSHNRLRMFAQTPAKLFFMVVVRCPYLSKIIFSVTHKPRVPIRNYFQCYSQTASTYPKLFLVLLTNREYLSKTIFSATHKLRVPIRNYFLCYSQTASTYSKLFFNGTHKLRQ